MRMPCLCYTPQPAMRAIWVSVRPWPPGDPEGSSVNRAGGVVSAHAGTSVSGIQKVWSPQATPVARSGILFLNPIARIWLCALQLPQPMLQG